LTRILSGLTSWCHLRKSANTLYAKQYSTNKPLKNLWPGQGILTIDLVYVNQCFENATERPPKVLNVSPTVGWKDCLKILL
jgi:hypothetical protein